MTARRLPFPLFLSSSLQPGPTQAKRCLPSLSTARPSWVPNREAKTGAQGRSACQPGQPCTVRIDPLLGKPLPLLAQAFLQKCRGKRKTKTEGGREERMHNATLPCYWRPLAELEGHRDAGKGQPEHWFCYWPAKSSHVTSWPCSFCALLPMSASKNLQIFQGLIPAV